jgi:hypothetical protein
MDPPNPIGTGVRFGCGAVLGLIVGLYWAGQVWLFEVGPFLATIVVCALTCGWLATRFGLRFWEAVASLRWWV